jgi:hypothetical protein
MAAMEHRARPTRHRDPGRLRDSALDGHDHRAALLSDRLATTLRDAGRPCVRLTDDTCASHTEGRTGRNANTVVRRIVDDIGSVADVVGITIAEFIPAPGHPPKAAVDRLSAAAAIWG